MQRAIALFFLGASVLAPCMASAQDADALVAEGLALRREGRDAEAVERFRAAYAIDGSARSLAQVALAEQASGQWVAAERDLVAALAIDDPWVAEHRAVLESALATIRTHLGRLSVVADVEGAELWIDGERAATLPTSEPISAPVGTLVVEVRAEGYVTVQRSATIRAGELSRVPVELVRVSVTPEASPPPVEIAPPEESSPPELPAAPAAPSEWPSPLLVTGLTGFGIAALTLAGAVIAGAVREENVLVWNSEAECPGPDRLGSCPERYSTLRTAEDWAIGLGVASGAFALASAILVGMGAAQPSGTEAALMVSPTGVYGALTIEH